MNAALTCLGERSQQNNYMKAVIVLVTYAERATHQLISILSYLELTVSYSSLIDHGKTKKQELEDSDEEAERSTARLLELDPEAEDSDSDCKFIPLDMSDNSYAWDSDVEDQTPTSDSLTDTNADSVENTAHQSPVAAEEPGTNIDGGGQKVKGSFLNCMSSYCSSTLYLEALTDLLTYVYDNLNTVFKVAEQIVSRKNAQENGTCATAFQLHKTSRADLQTKDLLNKFDIASDLAVNDIILLNKENHEFNLCLKHTILHIMVFFGGDLFARFKDAVLASTPQTTDKISLHKIKIMPLPYISINEATTTGNADVVSEIFGAVGKSFDTPGFSSILKLIASDQLSVARVCSIIMTRAGYTSFMHSLLWLVIMPGLLHYKMALIHSFMELHYG